MIRMIEAVIDEQGSVLLQGPIVLPAPRRALVTILEEEPADAPLPQDCYPLRGTPIQYQDPMEPVAEQEWEALTLNTEGTCPLSPRIEIRGCKGRLSACADIRQRT